MQRPFFLLATTLCCLTATAQTLSGIMLDPAVAKVGEPVTITGSFTDADNPNCNVRVHFGDGQTQDFKINQAKDVPLVATRSYAKPGQYKVMLEPKTALPTLKCVGENRTAMLTVAASVAAPSPMAKGAAAAPSCPAGWKLNAKSVNRKNGAFTCTARIGTPLPTARLECPPPLGYFENKSRGQLGCRP